MTQRLASALLRRGRAWAGQITSLAKTFAPDHLKAFIHSSATEPTPGTIVIRTRVNNSNPTGPGHPNYGTSDARAQEFGSGLRARRGAKGKYLIVPKNSPFLEFEGTNQFDGWLIRTKVVHHPGIQAANAGKGYIAPAFNEIRKRGRADLTKDIREAILGDLRSSFRMKK